MSLSVRSLSYSLAGLTVMSTLAGCGREEIPYKPRPAPTAQVSLPAVPNVPQRPLKSGDAYTVWGASYTLRNRVHRAEVAGKEITIEGYIVKTNLADAPECAVHKAGKADPENCKPPIPAFWIGDSKDAPLGDSIKVMGWASNFAQLYDAIELIEKDKEKAQPQDTFWAVPIPNPIPVAGVKVKVTGRYASTFTNASAGAEADPVMGLMTYQKIEYLEQPAEPALLPGMKKK